MKFWDMKHSSNSINQIIIQPDHVIDFNLIQAGNMQASTELGFIRKVQIPLGSFFILNQKVWQSSLN